MNIFGELKNFHLHLECIAVVLKLEKRTVLNGMSVSHLTRRDIRFADIAFKIAAKDVAYH